MRIIIETLKNASIFKLVCFITGVALLILAIILCIMNLIKLILCRKQTTAVITDFIRAYRNERLVYIPEIGYIVNDAEYYQNLAPNKAYGLNQKFKIMVNEKNPNMFMLNKSGFTMALICLIFGLVFCVIGVIICS